MDPQQVRRRHEDALMALPNVNGVSVGQDDASGQAVLQVFVTQKLPAGQLTPDEVIPESLEGLRVDVVELGDVSALGADLDPGPAPES